jgi:serine/threonine protein kinase
VLEQLENARGVLPMLDVHCPERIAADEHVWLALPIAMPIRDAAAEASAPAIIEGVAQIADTMATLHAAGISHRDLKPENLYKWNGRWVVSDFGIASFPGKAELTVGVDKLGPVHYIAPEMLLDPENADGSAADVYSLAKTLWVLACGQKYPPPGEQRVDVVEVRLEEWVDSDGIDDLNSLLEACTQHSPAQRPSMQEMAQSLSEWLAD